MSVNSREHMGAETVCENKAMKAKPSSRLAHEFPDSFARITMTV
jgi:hypothetical protein